jgi:PAS domain S-box-containing protein
MEREPTERGASTPSSAYRRYLWAVLAIALALVARAIADAPLGDQLPYSSMLAAAVFVAWFSGLGPALVVVIAGGLAVNILFVAPRGALSLAESQGRFGLIGFCVVGGVVAAFGGYGRAQRARARATADAIRRADAALREAHDELEARVARRTAELADSNASLVASEERFRVLVEGVRGYAMVMLGPDGTIASWNRGAERLFGRGPEVVGTAMAELVPGLDGDALGEAAAGGTVECAAQRAGAAVPIELVITALDERFVAIVHDVSERKRLEALTEQKQHRADELRRKSEQLEADNRRMLETNRLQGEFLANMSHELRTPLNAIIGFADVLHGGMAGDVNPQQREFLGDILTSSRHLLGLINEILDLAKVESGTVELAPEPIALAPVVTEVRDILRGTAASRRVELEAELADDLGLVTVDPGKLRQILYNFVSNAIKFTPEGGRVTVRARRTDPTFRIEVEDTGIGIAESDLRYLFVAFRQLDGGATKRYGGTGLGLALSKRLAEAQGGVVGVRSARGVGSTFWVELPVRSDARSAVQASPGGGRKPE